MKNRKLTPGEMGARDGAKLRERSGPFTAIHGPAVARISGERHLGHVASKRLTVGDVVPYCQAFIDEALKP